MPILETCPRLLSSIFILESVLMGPFGLMVRYPSNQQRLLTPAEPTSNAEGEQTRCQKPNHSRGRKEGKGPLLTTAAPSVHKVLRIIKDGLRQGRFHRVSTSRARWTTKTVSLFVSLLLAEALMTPRSSQPQGCLVLHKELGGGSKWFPLAWEAHWLHTEILHQKE